MIQSVARLRLYAETIRRLRPIQIYRRLWFDAVRPKPDLRPPPSLRDPAAPLISPARRKQSQTGPGEFRFLNETRSLSQHGWDDPALSKLWRYNLHYLDDLNAEGADQHLAWRRKLIVRWIEENPPGAGVGWEPYPTSLRVVNWIKWARAEALPARAVHSLAVQTRWLARRLEYHLLGNHLFSNAKALIFAGCFFEGAEAEGWLDLGLRILAREISEQILPDGGHFELSPMYHALALEDMLDLINVTRSYRLPVPAMAQTAHWPKRVDAMRTWLKTMCHPDGEIAFFNDASIGVAPSPAALERYASRLGFSRLAEVDAGCLSLPESGYLRLENGRAVALLDVARIGPDYLPGHAHADTLSFELSIDGQRALVNSGTSVYGTGPERLRQRSTGAHNCVEIDGENSSEVWSGFRVARRARPEGLGITREGGEWIVACSHDGYTRLPGRPRHRRSWRFARDKLTVSDKVEGPHDRAVAAYHFHPALAPSATADGSSGALAIAQHALLRWRVAKGSASIEPSTWHPEFGVSFPAQRLLVTLCDGESAIEFSWANA